MERRLRRTDLYWEAPRTGYGSWLEWCGREGGSLCSDTRPRCCCRAIRCSRRGSTLSASATTTLAEGKAPEAQFSRALGWFQEAGLEEPIVRTVVGTVHAPIEDGARRALISLFGMLWGEMQSRMNDADREEYLRLTEPASPDFILDASDYYAYFTYSMFEGRVAQ